MQVTSFGSFGRRSRRRFMAAAPVRVARVARAVIVAPLLMASVALMSCASGATAMKGPFFVSHSDGRVEIAGAGSTARLIATSAQAGGYFDVVDHRWLPDTGFPMHAHDFDEFYFVLDGTVIVEFEDGPTFTGTPGSFFYNPKGAFHSGRDATGEGFRMLMLYAPSFGEGMDRIMDAVLELNPDDPSFGAQVSALLESVGHTQGH